MNEIVLRRAVTLYALAGLLVALLLVVLSRRIGAARSASWLVVLGLGMLKLEEPGLTLWLALSRAPSERDGMAALITPQARAHVLDASIFAALFLLALGWLALDPWPRGEPWAKRGLWLGWLACAGTLLATVLFVYSRGLPLPTPGGSAPGAGYGWQPLAVGLFVWVLGLARQPSAREKQ